MSEEDIAVARLLGKEASFMGLRAAETSVVTVRVSHFYTFIGLLSAWSSAMFALGCSNFAGFSSFRGARVR